MHHEKGRRNRRGELLAIQLKNVKTGYLEIQKTWDTELSRLTTTTKNGKHQNVVLKKTIDITA